MGKTVFSDTPPQGTIVTALFLNAVNNHRHTGRDNDGEGALDYAVATGSNNAYVLSLSPALDAHVAGMPIIWKANHANSGAATLNVNSIGAVSLKKNISEVLEAGDILSDKIYIVLYDGTNLQLLNPSGQSTGISGAVSNLFAGATGADKYIKETIGEITLYDSAGNTYKTLRNIKILIDSTASGANGLDTGSLAADTWYSKWVIYNPSTGASAGILSLPLATTGNVTSGSDVVSSIPSTTNLAAGMPLRSANLPAGTVIVSVDSATQVTVSNLATASGTGVSLTFLTPPTMPSGYTYKARTGFVRTDGTANKYPLSFKQLGRVVEYQVRSGSNVTSLPVMASGSTGGISTWSAVSVLTFVPPTAALIRGRLNQLTAAGTNQQGCQVGPKAGDIWASYMPNQTLSINPFSGILESTGISWASGGGDNTVSCAGWEDNL